MALKGDVEEPIQSRQDKAYFHLLRRILSGALPAGTPLPEALLAKQLGISRTPLREAIRRLAAEGFLRQIPNRGSIVAEFSKRDIGELYELREALEVYAIGKAAECTLRPQDLENLQRLVADVLALRDELVASGEPGLSAEQMQRFVQVDLSFHTTLVRTAANRFILKAFADTRVLLNIFAMRRKGHSAELLAEIHIYHSEVLAAVVRRDPVAAMRLMGEHIRLSQQERLREYDEWERDALLDRTSQLTEAAL
ncbi:MAG TPA: GntR family transcriptional regulator [Bryobacteraceae bacterium]|nr:GntR family transcriptional regulator [Bryobacteraceae bacterium]